MKFNKSSIDAVPFTEKGQVIYRDSDLIYADKVDQDRVALLYDNGARLVPLGQHVRNKDRSDCWARGEHSVCVAFDNSR